ncbi:unnamed protein product [Protopolystoma xenopodis]|uniref:Uncharacterized protein n=1 Tax=Protopolystoma xenopodis TaxID=117903 RepID=A0A3S5B7Z5_9PLAT|nr:unnamed protein product [Protopolystoma xenopodis]
MAIAMGPELYDMAGLWVSSPDDFGGKKIIYFLTLSETTLQRAHQLCPIRAPETYKQALNHGAQLAVCLANRVASVRNSALPEDTSVNCREGRSVGQTLPTFGVHNCLAWTGRVAKCVAFA